MTLPADWLGKCHACHLGANAASGEWLLFTDADCWLEPTCWRARCRRLELHGAGHMVMTPGLAAATFAAQAWHLTFLVGLLAGLPA